MSGVRESHRPKSAETLSQTEQGVELDAEQPHRSWLAAALTVEYGPCSVAAAELASAAHSIVNSGSVKKVAVECSEPLLRYIELNRDYRMGSWSEVLDNIELEKVGLPKNSEGSHFRDLKRRRIADAESGGFQTKRCYGNPLGGDYSLIIDTQTTESHETIYVQPATIRRKFGKDFVPEKQTYEAAIKKTESSGNVWLAQQIAGGKVLLPLATFEERINGNCSYVQLGQEISDDSIFGVQSDEETERLRIINDLRQLVVPDGQESEITETVQSFASAEIERNFEAISVALGAWISDTLKAKLKEKRYFSHLAVVEPDNTVNYQDRTTKIALDGVIDELGLASCTILCHQPFDSGDSPIILSAISRGNVAFPIAEFLPGNGGMRFLGVDDLTPQEIYQSTMAIVALLDKDDTPEFQASIDSSEVTPSAFLVNKFRVQEKIMDRLSPTCADQEKLAWSIGCFALDCKFKGTLDDFDMTDKIRGSVKGNIVLQRVNEIFQARISAKPEKLKGIPMSEIRSFVYDPTGPLGDEDEFPKGADAAEFTRLIDSFQTEVK